MDSKKQKQLDYLIKRNLIIHDFIVEADLGNLTKDELLAFNWKRQILVDAYNSNNLGGLRIAYNDNKSWTLGISVEKRKELDNTLQAEFGLGIYEVNLEKVTDNIILSKTIKNAKEFRFVCQYIEENFMYDNKKEKIKNLNHLLSEVDEKIGNRKFNI